VVARGPCLLTFVRHLRQLLQAPWPNGSRGVLRPPLRLPRGPGRS
jgi:hypothetical protein